MTTEKEYKVGDTVYFIAPGSHLLVRCTIREVDDYFRKQHSDAHLFYDLDEPVGHNVAADEIYDTLDEGLAALREIILDDKAEGIRKDCATLRQWRERRAKSIRSTHPTDCTCGCDNMLALYTEKLPNIGWWTENV